MAKLTPWGKLVWHALIDRDMSIRDLATGCGMTREYTSAVVYGRVYSESAVKKISSYLDIPDTGERVGP